MGQQQLLLIALSVLIVGAAVAVGVNMFQEGSEQAQVEPFYQTASMAATNFASFLKKPTTMGGLGGNLGNYSGNDWGNVLGIPTDQADTDGLYVSNVDTITVSYDIDGDTEDESVSTVEVTLDHVASQYQGVFQALENGDVIWDNPSGGPFSNVQRPVKQ